MGKRLVYFEITLDENDIKIRSTIKEVLVKDNKDIEDQYERVKKEIERLTLKICSLVGLNEDDLLDSGWVLKK